jgi:membrane-associated phospholipid phosphatase
MQATDRNRFNLGYYSILLIVLVTAAWAIKKGDEVVWINGLHTAWLDRYFSSITHFGNAAYFLPVLLALLFLRYSYALSMLITGISHALVVLFFKRALFPNAGRPVTFLEIEQLHLVPGVDVHSHMSFPSGHTATAFAFMVVLSLCLKHRLLTVLFSFIALSVGISRIYLLQHFGWDVAIGAAVGTLCAWVSYKLIHDRLQHPALQDRIKVNLKTGIRQQIKMLNERLNLPI